MRILSALLLAAAAVAQTNPGTVDGPLLGLVADPNGVRLLTGIPGSATLGAPVDTGAALDHAAVSVQGFALATESESGAAVLVTLTGSHRLPGIPAGASSIAISPRGTAAAFYYKESRSAYLVSGLPDASQPPRQIALDRQPMAL